MNLERITQAVEECVARGGDWDASEITPASEFRASIPWAIVEAIHRNASDFKNGDTVVALTCTFAARRSLACWFLYCDDPTPLRLADRLVAAILKDDRTAITQEDKVACTPTENGIPIVDCRVVDTSIASKAVACAAAYFLTRNREFAIYALDSATGAFNESPIGSQDFEERMLEWLLTVAIPAAAELRELTLDEQAALADFSPFLLRR